MQCTDLVQSLEDKVSYWESYAKMFADENAAPSDWGHNSNFGNVSGGLISSLNNYLQMYELEHAEKYIVEAELYNKALKTYFYLLRRHASFKRAELDTTKGKKRGYFSSLMENAMKQGKIRLYVEKSKELLEDLRRAA